MGDVFLLYCLVCRIGWSFWGRAKMSDWVLLTCSNLHIPRDDPPDGVRRHASVDCTVNVLPVGGGRKGQQHQRAVPENPPDAAHVTDRGAVHRQPVYRRLGTPRGGAVQPATGRVGELEPRRWFHHERGPPQVGVEGCRGA